jgi:serine/threonine-protein kinase
MPDRITPARWQEIEPLLDAALDCAPAGRDAFVMTATASDPALRAELEALLRDAADGSPLQLLDRSASEVFVSLLRDDSEIVARVFAEEFAGRYTISKRIGAGGMATVYLAHDVRHDREVAIKILHPELTATIGSARFEREIRMTARLQHPHLLPLLDSGEAGGQLFYVMPYVKGESLRARLDRERQLPILDALRITREAASALDNAHRHGAVHRDIKPENILMHEGQALVADWGIALPTAAGERQPLTADGFRLGTPQYMSPEQAVGDRAIDARSDVYSLGCVLYEMLTGEPPFTGATAQVVIEKVKNERPPPPSSVRETVSPRVEAAVLKALAKLPADRFQSAAEFAAALAEPDVTSVVLAVSHRARYIALVTLATALAVALGYVMLRGGLPRPVSRLRMALPAGQGISSADSPRFTLSPDGSALAYVGPGPRGHQLWIKKRDQLSSVALAGTDNAEQPVVSPDGRRIAFYSEGRQLGDGDGRSTGRRSPDHAGDERTHRSVGSFVGGLSRDRPRVGIGRLHLYGWRGRTRRAPNPRERGNGRARCRSRLAERTRLVARSASRWQGSARDARAVERPRIAIQDCGDRSGRRDHSYPRQRHLCPLRAVGAPAVCHRGRRAHGGAV